ncbi:MAG: PTS system mannose/fructose/sorbose family transporter subunit IID [Erysipelotrichaceae bacterium]|nr:PTS system mannose/fructose/sorbose family transporter subunit IID [Erysipelotrichaceae bacterium]
MSELQRLNSLKENNKFVNDAFWGYNWSVPMCFTRERMLGCSMVCTLAKVADQIYPEDVEKQKELCRNHEVFFNTQQGLGAVVWGIVLGMEVERAKDDTITNELIQSVKQALAGPLAGLGDSLIQALLTPIIISIGIGLSTGTGSIMGPLFMFVAYTAVNAALSYGLFKLGYKSGIQGAEMLISSDLKDRAIPAFEALGITVIGGVLAGIMNVKTALVAKAGETVVNIQTQVLDAFFPKFLSLVVCFVVYYLVKEKKWSATKIMLWMIPVAIVGFLTKILA